MKHTPSFRPTAGPDVALRILVLAVFITALMGVRCG